MSLKTSGKAKIFGVIGSTVLIASIVGITCMLFGMSAVSNANTKFKQDVEQRYSELDGIIKSAVENKCYYQSYIDSENGAEIFMSLGDKEVEVEIDENNMIVGDRLNECAEKWEDFENTVFPENFLDNLKYTTEKKTLFGFGTYFRTSYVCEFEKLCENYKSIVSESKEKGKKFVFFVINENCIKSYLVDDEKKCKTETLDLKWALDDMSSVKVTAFLLSLLKKGQEQKIDVDNEKPDEPKQSTIQSEGLQCGEAQKTDKKEIKSTSTDDSSEYASGKGFGFKITFDSSNDPSPRNWLVEQISCEESSEKTQVDRESTSEHDDSTEVKDGDNLQENSLEEKKDPVKTDKANTSETLINNQNHSKEEIKSPAVEADSTNKLEGSPKTYIVETSVENAEETDKLLFPAGNQTDMTPTLKNDSNGSFAQKSDASNETAQTSGNENIEQGTQNLLDNTKTILTMSEGIKSIDQKPLEAPEMQKENSQSSDLLKEFENGSKKSETEQPDVVIPISKDGATLDPEKKEGGENKIKEISTGASRDINPTLNNSCPQADADVNKVFISSEQTN